jgi:hypothetical protein
VRAPLWALLAILVTPVLPIAVIAVLTTSTPRLTRQVAAALAATVLVAEVVNPILRASVARVVHLEPPAAAMMAGSCLVLVATMVGIVWSDRRHEAFRQEWAAYVTAENEGQRAPSAPPRFAQVARSLAHNQRAVALREHPGVRPGGWRNAGAVPAATSPAAAFCESCLRAPATVGVTFPDGEVFAVCAPCARTRPHRAPRSRPISRTAAVVLRKAGGDPE